MYNRYFKACNYQSQKFEIDKVLERRCLTGLLFLVCHTLITKQQFNQLNIYEIYIRVHKV